MKLNPTIWQQVIEAAKRSAANSRPWLRAIGKAAEQIQNNPCITELADGVLITSPSGAPYHANGSCQCKAYSFGQPCWHRAAAQLIARYNEALAAQARDERAELIADIKATWSRRFPGESLADELMARFRVNALSMLNVDFLRRILAAIA